MHSLDDLNQVTEEAINCPFQPSGNISLKKAYFVINVKVLEYQFLFIVCIVLPYVYQLLSLKLIKKNVWQTNTPCFTNKTEIFCKSTKPEQKANSSWIIVFNIIVNNMANF